MMPHILPKFVLQYKKKIKYIYIYTIIMGIIKTSRKLKVSSLSEAWAWELGQPLQGGSLSPYP